MISFKRFLKSPLSSIKKQTVPIYDYIHRIKYNNIIQKKLVHQTKELTIDLLFPDNRINYKKPIEKVKYISTHILDKFNYLSKKHNFSFFLAYGTLLGAVRHKGFIPWDDDIDIMMTQSDFNKFLNIIQELPPSLTLLSNGRNFFKLMDKKTIGITNSIHGISVDIFILDEHKEHFSFISMHTYLRVFIAKNSIFPLVKKHFENKLLDIPNNYDTILKSIYGDYMQLPPEEKRIYPHYPEDLIF